MRDRILDIAVVGAGAAGLATAIFAARGNPDLSIALLDGAKKPGAKILISGGGRCNVTNDIVTAADFHGGSANVVRRTLAAFPAVAAAAFFRELGVALHVEENGKLFPDNHRAHTVLDALLAEVQRLRIRLLAGHRVTRITREDKRFLLETSGGSFPARRVVLATGGLSIPKSGSDGTGYRLAASLGHTLVPCTPALAPLVLDGDFHPPLSGIAHPAEIVLRVEDAKPVRVRGALLWTHFGVSGPAALDASRHWHRARLDGRTVIVTANLLPDDDFESLDATLAAAAPAHPTTHLRNLLSDLLPAKVSDAVLDRLKLDGSVAMAHLRREDRRTLVRALLEWPLPVRDSRGFDHAEVTAGGIPLSEVDPASFESRRCPGLHLVGEILDVDGRLGGFNFQWAWSSAWVAGVALATAASEGKGQPGSAHQNGSGGGDGQQGAIRPESH